MADDCGVETLPVDEDRAEWYMVTNAVWEQAGMVCNQPPDDTALLCIGCLEARIGRRLVAADFTNARVNDLTIADRMRYAWSWRTPRLTARLEAL